MSVRLMNDILFMMAVPFIAALILLVVKNDKARGYIAEIAAAIIILSSIWVAYSYLGEPQTFEFHSEIIDMLMFIAEVILGLVIIYLGVKHKKYAASVLGLVQLCMSLYFEFALKEGIEVERSLYIDDLSIIMVLLALLLSLIAVLRIRKVGEKEIIATPLIIAVLLGLSYLMAKAELKDLLSLISFDRGSIMIGLGIILSLVSGILYAIIHRKEGADDEGSS